MKKILIGTATYNEYENISRLIKNIKTVDDKYDVLVVDDKSPDLTYKLLLKLKKKINNLNIIIRKKKYGLNSAHQKIYDFAVKKKYDFLVTMDADFSHDPKDIKKIIKYLHKYDFVIGSRYIKGGKCQMKIFRKILSFFGNKIIKIFLNTGLNENTTSLRGFNMQTLLKKNMHLKNINSNGYSFFMETVFFLKNKGCSMKEIPIKFIDRVYGSSKIPKLEILRTLKNIVLLRILN